MKENEFYNEQYTLLERECTYASLVLEDAEIYYIEKNNL
jgi:hypothetical protein